MGPDGEQLRLAPWNDVSAPHSVAQSMSMLTVKEKNFLYWLTSEYFQNQGAIIDAGCFVGGSTVALASGLEVGYPDQEIKIHTYDSFETQGYQEYFFDPYSLQPGPRFRHIFDTTVADLRHRIDLHDGDITSMPWDGRPIEILFLDLCKSWDINDYCNVNFFSHLIPGRSIIIQQDFFFPWCCWVILVMEELHDYFEFIGYVEWTTAAFRCTKAIPKDIIPLKLRDLGLPHLERLMLSVIAKQREPYLVAVLNCALLALYLDFEEYKKFAKLRREVAKKYSDFPHIVEHLNSIAGFLSGLLPEYVLALDDAENRVVKLRTARDAAIRERDDAVAERDAIVASSLRWFDAVIAVTPDHNPLAGVGHRRRRWTGVAGHGRPSPIALADRARDAGKWELAVRYYRDALDIVPDDPQVWEQCGYALKRAGKIPEADFAFQRSRELAASGRRRLFTRGRFGSKVSPTEGGTGN